jgi:S-adenosylmethionine:tRNA ribosyltransferase-isomerase
MRADLFDYDLPAHLIAQEPCAERDRSRLLVVRRKSGALAHHTFRDLLELLAPGDLLVLNDTRVVPARLLGRRGGTGGKWEGLFLGQAPGGCWELLCQTGGKLGQGETIRIEPGPLELVLVDKNAAGHWLARPNTPGPALDLLEQHGQVPLPPYIRKGRACPADRQRYQTVFAQSAGAVAAPTAGLHFTQGLFQRLEQRGIGKTFVTLHVGLGTFQPIHVEDVTQHRMHREWGALSDSAAKAISACRERGGRVVAVGTTSVRVLETAAAVNGDSAAGRALAPPILPWSGETELYIYPPFRFRAVDAMITNFHLPRSSLLLLVSAFAGAELIREAYRVAMEQHYRFYSYGDAMLIV